MSSIRSFISLVRLSNFCCFSCESGLITLAFLGVSGCFGNSPSPLTAEGVSLPALSCTTGAFSPPRFFLTTGVFREGLRIALGCLAVWADFLCSARNAALASSMLISIISPLVSIKTCRRIILSSISPMADLNFGNFLWWAVFDIVCCKIFSSKMAFLKS